MNADAVIARVEKWLGWHGGFTGYVERVKEGATGWSQLRSNIWLAVHDLTTVHPQAVGDAAEVERLREALGERLRALAVRLRSDVASWNDNPSSECRNERLAIAKECEALALRPQAGDADVVGERAPDEDWLAEVLDDSLDMDWTGRVGARAIIAAWSKRHGD